MVKNEINILITAVSRKVQLIKSFRRSLNRISAGSLIVGIDVDPYSAGLFYCDKYFIAPPSNSPDFPEFLMELCKKEKIKLVIPTIDEELPLFASYKDIFASIGVTLLVSDSKSI